MFGIFEMGKETEIQKIFFTESSIVRAPSIAGEELNRSNKNNIYIPTWVNLNVIPTINLLPIEGKIKLQHYLYSLENGKNKNR